MTTDEISPEPPVNGLARRIRTLLPSLVPSEARVAEALLGAAPSIVPSVAELAAIADTSPASVVRACQSLGFSGFNELTAALERERRLGERPPRAAQDAEEVLRRTVQAGVEQLQSMARTVDVVAFADAVEALIAARRVLVFAASDLSLIGQYAAFRFTTIGRAVEAPADAVTAHVAASGLTGDDVCLAIGGSGANELTVRVTQAAADAGARIVAITSFPRGPLADLASMHLVVGTPRSAPSDGGPATVRVSQMLAVDALQAAMRERGQGRELRELVDLTLNSYTHRRPRRRSPG